MPSKFFNHPLSETFDAKPETGNEETINSWGFATMIANVAAGRLEGDQRTSIGMAKELTELADRSVNADILILQSSLDDAEMMKLINLCNQGLEIKLDKAFEGS
jgi:hypothetical protein